jgi:hypothetical protein
MTMTLEELSAAVQDIQDRQAILDCIYRYCRGVDRFDADLLRTVYHDDALDEHGKFVGNGEEFIAWAVGQHSRSHLSTQHCILNHRCEIDGATAHAETYFMFVSMNRKGPPLNMNGGRYVDRLERRCGEWRIAARVCLRDWAGLDKAPDMSDLSSMTSTRNELSDEMRAFMNGGLGSKRDKTDPSYMRPLTLDPARREAYQRLAAGRTNA